MKARSLLPAVLAIGVAYAAPVGAQEEGNDPLDLAVETYRLANGMEVVLHEDHRLPLAAVNIWYHVGSANEVTGRTGFAHLFEHLMFQGSGHFDQEYFSALAEAGARINGSTSTDRTNYYEMFPSNFLERALWLEADRMGWLLPVLTQEKLDNQREVVRNERRQNYENRPYRSAFGPMMAALYPEGHPYHHLTIGSHEDLEAASLDDVSAFFDRYYAPNNATLVVAGDFDRDQAVAWIEQYFGPIPTGEEVPPLEVAPTQLEGELRMVETDRVEQTKLQMVWHSPALYADGDAELDYVSQIFQGGKNSRLFRSIVHEQRLATQVEAYQWSRAHGSLFVIEAMVHVDHTPEEVEAAIQAEIHRFIEEGPTETEMTRSINRWEKSFYGRLGSLQRKADMLNAYNQALGEPNSVRWDLDRYRNVTPEGVQQVARDVLLDDRRLILIIEPEPPEATEDAPEAETGTEEAE